MGRRGPQPKPLSAIKLTGRYRPGEYGNRKEAQRDGMTGIPQPPDDLGEHGVEAWNTICREWRTMGGLVKIDAYTLHAFCINWDRYKSRGQRSDEQP